MLYLTTLCEVFSIFFPSNYPVGQATVAPHLPRRPTGACPALQNTPNRICWLAGYGLAVLPVSLVALSDRPEVRLTVCAFSSQGNATRTLTISLLAFAYCFQLFMEVFLKGTVSRKRFGFLSNDLLFQVKTMDSQMVLYMFSLLCKMLPYQYIVFNCRPLL